jgi:peptide/nickel transport system substrate-binding protein
MWTGRSRQDRARSRPRGGRGGQSHAHISPATGLRSGLALMVTLLLVGAAAQACTAGGSDSNGPGGSKLGGAGNTAATAYRIGARAWGSSIANNPYAPTPTPHYNLSLLSLGVVSDWNRPGSNPYYPELAKSWTLGKHSISFDLRTDAQWQDGKPFTSKDVLTAIRAAGADYNSVWAAITKISAPDDHSVTVDLQRWAVPQNALLHLLQIVIVPDSQYGSLIPSSGFDQTLISYWRTYNILHPTAASISKAGNSPEGKSIAAAAAKLVKFNPDPMIGTGPYRLKSANVSGVLYQKWDGFWDAKKITAPAVQLYPMDSSTEYGAIIGGTIEQELDSQFSDPQVTRMNATGVAHYGVIPSPVQQESLVFNFNHYPFNLRAARQALAYVIDRHDLVKRDMGGDLVQDPAEETPDGINYFLAKQYLSQDQFATLNHYPHDLAKAAAVLQRAGFSKRDGRWFTPKGTPFSFTISEPNGLSQFVQDGLIIAGYLKSFGIDAKVEDVDAATYTTKQQAGDFAVSEWYMDWGQGPPMADFAATFGQPSAPSWNYPISYSGKGPCKCAIGIGPEADVPGLGHVNIASELNREVNQAPPQTWAKYTWAWAQWVNQELPILPLYNNAFHTIYQTNRYTNFPPQSEKWLWTVLSGADETVVWMQNGYLKLG